MTTIAYCHKTKTLAADGRLTRGSLIVTDRVDKFATAQNGDVLVLAGDVSACDALVTSWPASPKKSANCRGFAVVGGHVFYVNLYRGELSVTLCEDNDAVGSGEDFALAALDAGFDAPDAVRAASVRDIYTGGDIKKIDVE